MVISTLQGAFAITEKINNEVLVQRRDRFKGASCN